MSNSCFTSAALGAIRLAQENAAQLGHSYVGSEHLLLGLACQERSLSARILRDAGIDQAALRTAIAQLVGTGVPGRTLYQGLTPQCCQAIQLAAAECRRLRQSPVGTVHLLLGLLREPDSPAQRLLSDCRVDSRALYQSVHASLGGEGGDPTPIRAARRESERTSGDTRQLDQCARDLTRMAAAGYLDPVIGREAESPRPVPPGPGNRSAPPATPVSWSSAPGTSPGWPPKESWTR